MRTKKFKSKYKENLLVNVLDYLEFPHLSYRDTLIFPSINQNRKFCNHLWQSLGLGNTNRKTVSEFFS